MVHEDEAGLSLEWRDTLEEELTPAERRVVLGTSDGDVECRFHPSAGAMGGVVWVGGADGGLDGPARGLYPEMCRRLQAFGIAGLRLHNRIPNQLEACVLDTLMSVEYLAEQGVERVAVVGHSFGGAVAITAAAVSKRIVACVPMSTQTNGTDLADRVSPRPMLLIHGTADEVLPGARHGLDEAREQVLDLLTRWLVGRL